MTDTSTDAPPWLEEMVQSARSLLGVGDDWAVFLSVEDKLDNGGAAGMCHPDPIYLRADMAFARGHIKQDDRKTREYVLHEVLHLALAEIDYAMDCAIDAAPRKLRKTLRSAYVAATERSIQRMSRALARSIEERRDERSQE